MEIVKRFDGTYGVCETTWIDQGCNTHTVFSSEKRKDCVEWLQNHKSGGKKNELQRKISKVAKKR